MKIDMIDLRLSDDRKIFNKLQPIINENLDGFRRSNILSLNYEWTHLFIAKENGKIVGFVLIRRSSFDQHNTGFEEYYYISDIVMSKAYQNKGYGTQLLKKVLGDIKDLPVVASVRDDNVALLKLFKKFMMIYNQRGRYYKFMDKTHYELRGDTISWKFRL